MAQQLQQDEAGNIWDTSGPQPVFVRAAGQQSDVGVVAPNPVQAQRQQTELGGAQLGNQKTAQQIALDAVKLQTAPQMSAEELRAQQLANQKAERDLAAPVEAKQTQSDRLSRLRQLAGQVGRTQALYDSGIGQTKGIKGVLDYLPTDANARFDVAGASLSQQGLAAFRVPGTGTVSDRDAMMFDRANLPTSATRDAAVEEQLRSIRNRVDEEMKALGQQPMNWAAVTQQQGGQQGQNPGAPLIASGGGGGGNPPPPTGPAGYDVAGVAGGVSGGPGGAGSTFADAAGVAMATKLKQAYNQGAGVQQLNQLLTENGYQPFADPQAIEAINKRGPLNFAPPQVADNRGALSQAIGGAADSAGGAYAISAADALSAGTLDNIAGGNAKLAQEYVGQKFPGASLAGTVTGGALGAAGAEFGAGALGARAGISALTGRGAALGGDGLYGAAYGAGSTDDGNRLLGAALGGAGGLAGGVAGRGVVDLAGRLGRGRFGLPQEAPVSRGQNIAVDALQADNFTPYQAAATLREANALGVPSIPADLGDNARGAFSSLARQPGETRSMLRAPILARQEGQGDRIRTAITEDLGPITKMRQQSDALIQQGRTAASPFYDQAYQTPVPSTPELDAVLNTPFGRQAIGRARTIAANERRNPSELNFALDANGNPVMNPFPGRQVADDLAARQELDAAQAAYREARNGPGNVDAARERIAKAREALRVSQQSLRGAPDPNAAASVPTYTTQTLDYAKRGMDDILEEQRNPVTGKLVLDEAGRAQNQVRQQLLREVDGLNPAYGNARAAYAGPAAERDALALGRDALRMSPEDVQVAAARLSPTQRQQFGLGYRTELSNQIDSRVDGADKVGALIGTPRKRSILATATGNSEGFGRFNQRLDAERAANETYRAVATGSPTASRLADDAIIGNDQAMANRIISAGQGFRSGGLVGGGIGLALDALKSATTYGLGKKAAAARLDAAQTLLSPEALTDVANTLGRNKAVRRVNDRAISKALQRPRQFGGLFGAPMLGTALPYWADQ